MAPRLRGLTVIVVAMLVSSLIFNTGAPAIAGTQYSNRFTLRLSGYACGGWAWEYPAATGSNDVIFHKIYHYAWAKGTSARGWNSVRIKIYDTRQSTSRTSGDQYVPFPADRGYFSFRNVLPGYRANGSTTYTEHQTTIGDFHPTPQVHRRYWSDSGDFCDANGLYP